MHTNKLLKFIHVILPLPKYRLKAIQPVLAGNCTTAHFSVTPVAVQHSSNKRGILHERSYFMLEEQNISVVYLYNHTYMKGSSNILYH